METGCHNGLKQDSQILVIHGESSFTAAGAQEEKGRLGRQEPCGGEVAG